MSKRDPIRIIRHETQEPDGTSMRCGSFEVRFADGRASQFFYWDDVAGRRMRPDAMDQEQAREKAKAFARENR